MRTEEEIRNRLNAVKMDYDFAISQGKEEQDILKMTPYIHALKCWNNKDVRCKHRDICKGDCSNIPENKR